MAADRQFPTSGTGPDYMAKIAIEGATLYNAACLPLTAAGGTSDDPQCTCAPPLSAGVLAGMSFWWTAASDNTGPMTMVIDGNAPLALKNDDGADLAAGVIKAGRRYLLTAAGGILIVTGTVNIQKVDDYQAFTTPGAITWYRPAGCPDDALAIIRMWAGGGGGGSQSSGNAISGGGGGGCVEWRCRVFDLGMSVSGFVAAGGAVGVAGENSTFAGVTAYGGGAGIGRSGTSYAVAGGSGGGALRKGSNGGATSESGITISGGPNKGDIHAGFGGNSRYLGTVTYPGTGDEAGLGGGAGGGGSARGNSGGPSGANGGPAITGGGGGGGNPSSSGGSSVFGGAGGNTGADGQPRGGGGGAMAAGGRGEIIVHVIG